MGDQHDGSPESRSAGDRDAGAPVRLVIIDDHAMVLDSLRAMFDAEPQIEVVGTAESKSSALDLLRSVDVDVVLTDLELGDGTGTELVEAAARLTPPVPTLLISGAGDAGGVQAAIDAGCAGFVSKSEPFAGLARAVIAVSDGASVFPAGLLSSRLTSPPAAPQPDLSPQETKALEMLAQGRTVAEIAADWYLSVHTVRSHVKSLMMKLGAHSQLQAVVTAARLGLVEIK